MDEIANYSESVFEDIKHVNEYSQEFWCARELQIALEYKQWRRFQNVIEKAKESCINSGNSVEDHFADVGKMIIMRSVFPLRLNCRRDHRSGSPSGPSCESSGCSRTPSPDTAPPIF